VAEIVGWEREEQIQRVGKEVRVFDELLVDGVEIEVNERVEALQDDQAMESKGLHGVS
jgi:hypothetical protein